MGHPWVFREAKHYLATGTHLRPVTAEQRFDSLGLPLPKQALWLVRVRMVTQ